MAASAALGRRPYARRQITRLAREAETVKMSPPVDPSSLIAPPMKATRFPSGDRRVRDLHGKSHIEVLSPLHGIV